MSFGKIVALDVGDVRIGIATCDEMRMIASPYGLYTRVGFGPDTRYIKELCDKLGTKDVLCGLPRNMDGTIGFQAKKVQALAEKLQEAGLNILWQDERLTTVTAEKALIEGGMHRADRKTHVDKVAAAVILQQYLDTIHYQESFKQEDNTMSDENKMIPEEEMNEEDNIVELTDDEGIVSKFEYLATVPYENAEYVVLSLIEEDGHEPESDEGDVIILEIQQDDNGEDIYVSVEDDDICQKVFDLFMASIDEEEE